MSNDNLKANNQYLSDLLDDQPNNEAVEQLLKSDVHQAKTWYRYNAVRSVLNKQHSVHSSFDFTQSISAKIAKEPSYTADTNTTDNVVSLFPYWKKTVGGLAMAASVAFAMVFSVQMMNNLPEEQTASGMDMATQSQQTLLPIETSLSPFDFKADQAEQEKLDDIQRMLNQMSRHSLNVTEELVGGEFMVQSFVVKTKNSVTPFEQKIRQMKKPSESIHTKTERTNK